MCSAICRNKIQPTEDDPWSGGKKMKRYSHMLGDRLKLYGFLCLSFGRAPKRNARNEPAKEPVFFFIRGCFDDYDVGFLYWSAFFRVSPWGHTGRPMSGRFVSFFDFFSSLFPPIACRKCHPIISISNTLSESKIKLKLPVIIHSVRITIN